MKRIIRYAVLIGLIVSSCRRENRVSTKQNQVEEKVEAAFVYKDGYSEVNGIKMYYQIYGEGKPLVLIHGGGSTIQSNFGQVIPMFAKNRKVIAMELQAHGRTNDRNEDSSFEQDADDVADLLKKLKIDKADFLGFSNGGTTTIQIALRHSEIVNKIVCVQHFLSAMECPHSFGIL